MNQFEFNVPRCTTFNVSMDSDDSEVEKYFDVDHEWNQPTHLTEEGFPSETEAAGPSSPTRAQHEEAAAKKTPRKTPRKSEFGLMRRFEGLTLTTPSRKSHSMETRQDIISPLILRSRKVSRVFDKPEPTECEVMDRKRRHKFHDEPPEKYVCMAEAVEKFQKATPARFHTKPRNMKFHGNSKTEGGGGVRFTVPVSPHLRVLQRNRPNHALSQKQLEELEIEEMKNHQIKARPLNEKVFKPPRMDLSHQSHVTEIQPFNLTEFKKKVQEPTSMVMKFTARPVPKGLFKKCDEKNTSAPSISHSVYKVPARVRVSVPKAKEKENELPPPPPVRKGPITTVPFSFYERDMKLLKKKEEKVKKILEEEKKIHEFHANPLPKFPTHPFREKPTMLPTMQKPFHLSADDRGKANKEKWEKKVEENEMQMRKAAEFKARNPVVLSKKPFIPVKPEHKPLETLDIHLNTEFRAKNRAEFDLNVQKKQEEMEKLRQERKKEMERREEEEVARLRKELIHKANPIRQYKEVSIHPSNKCLTLPQTPVSFRK